MRWQIETMHREMHLATSEFATFGASMDLIRLLMLSETSVSIQPLSFGRINILLVRKKIRNVISDK